MLQIRYSLARDPHQFATLFGDPCAVSNLYWQLTHNYRAQDGQAIGEVKVMDMSGRDVTSSVMSNPFSCSQALTTIER